MRHQYRSGTPDIAAKQYRSETAEALRLPGQWPARFGSRPDGRPAGEFPARRRRQRGAALIFALATALVVSTLVFGVSGFVAAHVSATETSRGYIRAVFIAEAAANYQLNRMSRSRQKDHLIDNMPGRLLFIDVAEGFRSSTPDVAIPLDETSSDPNNPSIVRGQARAQTTAEDGTSRWVPPDDFYVYASGTDTMTGISRYISFHGTGTELEQPFCLFGRERLAFVSSGGKTPTLNGNYIGTNGILDGIVPQTDLNQDSGRFSGCRLGPNAAIRFAGNLSQWDIARLPEETNWPQIPEMVQYIRSGTRLSVIRDPADNLEHTDNTEISYWDYQRNTFVELKNVDGSGPIDRLTNAEFSKSQGGLYRIIRLHGAETSGNRNTFFFREITMGSQDVLLLDMRLVSQAPAIRILIDDAVRPIQVTNLAYRYSTNQAINKDPLPYYHWYNNSTQPIYFQPNLSDGITLPIEQADIGTYILRVTPAVRGLVYAANPIAGVGKVILEPRAGIAMSVGSIVGNDVELRGDVTVYGRPPDPPGLPKDPNRYILNYHVNQYYFETASLGSRSARKPPVGHGKHW